MLAAPAGPEPTVMRAAPDRPTSAARMRRREGRRPGAGARFAAVDGLLGLGIGRRSVFGAATDDSSPPTCRLGSAGVNITGAGWRGGAGRAIAKERASARHGRSRPGQTPR